jgi:hypothetical protein
MTKDTLLGIAWLSGLLAYPVGEAWNRNVGSLLIVVFLLSLGAGLAKKVIEFRYCVSAVGAPL